MIKRGMVYEGMMFMLAFGLGWLVIGSSWKSFALAVLITICKVPIYCVFHGAWERRK